MSCADPARPARRHRPGRLGRPTARPAAPLQRPQGQVRHLPLPRPPRRTPPRRHRDQRHPHHPAAGPTLEQAPAPHSPQESRPGRSPAAYPAAACHRPDDHRAPPRLERPGARRTPPDHPSPAHPARRMGQARLHHPHRLRYPHAQPAASRYTLDNRARSLTARPCYARLASRRPLTMALGRDSTSRLIGRMAKTELRHLVVITLNR